MIHLGRASQMHHVKGVEPTFDILDSPHDYSQLPLKTQLLTPPVVWHTRCLKTGETTEERTALSATEVRYGDHAQIDS